MPDAIEPKTTRPLRRRGRAPIGPYPNKVNISVTDGTLTLLMAQADAGGRSLAAVARDALEIGLLIG